MEANEEAKVTISNVSYDPDINGSKKTKTVLAVTESGLYKE